MKNLIYIFIIIYGFYSCTRDKVQDNENSSLIGKWKLTEAYVSNGGPQVWVDVENGEEIEFFKSRKFNSNRFAECSTGIFSLEPHRLILEYDCNEFNPISENENGLITFKLEFHLNYFILTPTSGPICTEGCSYKYYKK